MAVKVRVIQPTAEVQQHAAEAARNLATKERVKIGGNDGSDADVVELYQYAWHHPSAGLAVEQLLKDCVRLSLVIMVAAADSSQGGRAHAVEPRFYCAHAETCCGAFSRLVIHAP